MHKSYESKQKPRIPKNSYFEGGLASLKIRLDEVMVKLDGSLRAPAEFLFQETIIKGDSNEKVIGLASIMAKVTRDRYMVKVSTEVKYAMYDFARHKGYGTTVHREAIAKNGLSTLHRASYCKNITIVV
jgi:ribonuclease HII